MTKDHSTGQHGALMDAAYRWQRHIYDVTRKYYLFGRDRMIAGLDLGARGEGCAVLEIGCGTGRNLALVRRQWPGAALHGVDISAEMLKTARARLGPAAALAIGDAATFSAMDLFGRDGFDRILLPYCTSMIPDWTGALDHACTLLARGGSLHLVDFGDMAAMPAILRRLLRWWLARFHVQPRTDLVAQAMVLAARHRLATRIRSGPGDYYLMVQLTRTT